MRAGARSVRWQRAAAVAILALANVCLAGQEKMSADLPRTGTGNVEIIVQYVNPPGQAHYDKVRGKGGELKKELQLIRGAHFSVPASAVADLAADPEIAYISPNRKLATLLDYGVPAVTADIVQKYGWSGKGIGVAVVDSGMVSRPDLQAAGSSGSRIVYSESFVATGDTVDQFGHGTHVAGIIGGNGKSSTGTANTVTFHGVAPGVNLVNLRALDANGAGSDSTVIAAIQRAIVLKKTYNIRVMNLSLGRQIYDYAQNDPLCQAVEQAWKAGIVVVVAAGNSGRDNSDGRQGYGTILSPGNDPYVITVGATKTQGTPGRTDDLVTSYSSKGPTYLDNYVKPDVVAPGNRIISLAGSGTMFSQFPGNIVPLSYYSTALAGNSGQYFRLSGTSMAAGFVSGAAALMLEMDPALTPDQIKARMMKTAWKGFDGAVSVVTDPADPTIQYTTTHDTFTVGAGYLDVLAALADTEVTTAAALSPKVVLKNGTFYIQFATNAVSPLRKNVVWGSNVVWSSNTSQLLSLRKNVVWGSATDIIWSTRKNVVWGSSANAGTESVGIAIAGEK